MRTRTAFSSPPYILSNAYPDDVRGWRKKKLKSLNNCDADDDIDSNSDESDNASNDDIDGKDLGIIATNEDRPKGVDGSPWSSSKRLNKKMKSSKSRRRLLNKK